MNRRRHLWALLLAGSAVGLSGCSGGAGATTCAEYRSMDFDQQTDMSIDLLREHDLDVGSTGNLAGVSQALIDYCGNQFGDVLHPSGVLDDITDWDSDTW